MSAIPSASAIQHVIENSSQSDEIEQLELDSIVKFIKSSDSTTVMKIVKSCLAEMEKELKSGTSKRTKNASKTKQGTPPQLRKNNAWVKFTLKYALANGWEAFSVKQVVKDKDSGSKTDVIVTMSASKLVDGAHVYEDSVTADCPTGRQIIHKEAMSLSKFWKENRQDIYDEFNAQYQESDDDSSADDEKSDESSSSSPVVKMTAAEREKELAAKRAQKEAEKEALKAQKAAEKEALKAQKEAEKDALKAQKAAEKDALKAQKAAEKDAKKSPKVPIKAVAVPKAPVKAAAVTPTPTPKPAEPATSSDTPKPAPKKLLSKLNAAAAAAPPFVPSIPKDDWKCPDDGNVYEWTFNGNKCYRTAKNYVWEQSEDGLGKWMGLFKPDTYTIDSSFPEPVFEE
jgi:hypothetical protein